MHLQDLPGAILRLILNDENSWCAIELWKCGNRTLNTRFANYGVTRIDLRDMDPTSTSRWPRCLSFFKLEHLSVERAKGPLGTPTTLRSELKKLPSTLLSLHLHGYHFLDALFPDSNLPNSESTPDASKNIEPQSEQPKSIDMNDDNQNRSIEWNLDTTWPCLERFEVADSRYGLDTFNLHQSWKTTLTPTFYASLPRSLTSFGLRAHFWSQTTLDNLTSLPPGLLVLQLPQRSISPTGLLTLPKSITNIGYCLNREAILTLGQNPSILPSLQDFSCQGNLDSKELIQHELMFSSTLTTLELGDRVEKFPQIAQLPPCLTRLILLQKDYCIDHQGVSALPRSLTNLKVTAIDWKDVKTNQWPAALQTLHIKSLLGFGYKYFSALPRALTTFVYEPTWMAMTVQLSTSDDPTLLLSIGRECLALEQEQWMIQKARLLRMFEGSSAYINRVESGELYGLPLGLMKLSLEPTTTTPLNYLLPPLIRRQNARFATICDNKYFERFPPSDTLCVHITELDVANERLQPSDTAMYRSGLNNLTIENASTTLTSAPGWLLLQCLPPSLTRFGLLSSVGSPIGTSELKYFPNTLTDLRLSSCNFAGDDWVEMLPRSLVKLELPRNTLISGAWIHKLPPKLLSIAASFNAVSITQARGFPPLLDCIYDKSENTCLDALMELCRPFWRIREYSDDYLTSEIAKALESESTPPIKTIFDIDPRVSARFNL